MLTKLISKYFELAIEVIAWVILVGFTLLFAVAGASSAGVLGFIGGLVIGFVVGAITDIIYLGILAILIDIRRGVNAIEAKKSAK